MVPKPRRPGQTGGSAYNKANRSTWASARVHQKAGSGGAKPPKKGGGFCSLWLLAILAIPATITVASVALAVRA